jgi:hypothetical protein
MPIPVTGFTHEAPGAALAAACGAVFEEVFASPAAAGEVLAMGRTGRPKRAGADPVKSVLAIEAADLRRRLEAIEQRLAGMEGPAEPKPA